MTRRTKKWMLVGVAAAVAAIGGGGYAVAGQLDDNEAPITGSALTRAKAAALEHTGGGRVTETEVGDEDSYYEVEVTFDDGTQVDVQLDESFAVVGSSPDADDGAEDGDDD